MLADSPILVIVLYNQFNIISLRKHLVIGLFSFSISVSYWSSYEEYIDRNGSNYQTRLCGPYIATITGHYFACNVPAGISTG